jgi:acetylornithine deacetylase/succinyl-diaminopimelate desuccinylase-like protein
MSAPAIPPDLDRWLTAHDAASLEDLNAFLKIPSVSASSAHNADTARAASFVHATLVKLGFRAEIARTPGHPIVLAEWRKAPKGAPTVLIYGHYDVQPAEPLDLWTSPPFEPTVRNGNLFARGSVDDKGQLWIHIMALAAHLGERGTLPVNVIVLAEGEEEVGSSNLAPFVQKNASRLACDAVVISDSAMFAPGIPSILSSLRGLAYFELQARGPASDLHSGMYGGAVVNPAMALAQVLSTLHDGRGRVAIRGFYDRVKPFPGAVLRGMRKLPHSDAHFRKEIGVSALGGEMGKTTLEKLWTRPTCEINGLLSGYTGEGAKTVLPGRAMAKVSFRLVPDQDPDVVERQLRAHINRVAPKGVTIDVKALHGGRPWAAELDGPLYDAARVALKASFGREPVIVGEGGSIPVVGDFERILKAPILLVGFGLPGENAHAPDEWISVDNIRRGARAMAILYSELGRPGSTAPAAKAKAKPKSKRKPSRR